jgi:predicted CXXCH cytochrome family protein
VKRLVPLARLLVAASAAADSVVGSRHDFSVTGPGPFRAASERSACIFCHTSHGSGAKLTNRPEIGNEHRAYASTTAKGRGNTPSGVSRICLSCHDGTIAVGQTRTKKIKMTGGADRLPPGHKANLGTDLRKSHPISMRQVAGAGTHSPARGGPVQLDAKGQVQCTSCHDPHAERGGDPAVGKFLVAPRARSNLCLACHDGTAVEGPGSSHANSPEPTAAALADEGHASVAEAGCGACHRPHGATERGRLVREGKTDDGVCLACHGEAGTARRIGAETSRPYAHASTGLGLHDANERNERDGPGRSSAKRHVTCVDCHDPHQANGAAGSAPVANGRLAGVWGVDLDGNVVEAARFEYEVCFKCHGDTAPTVAIGPTGDRLRRAFADTNLRKVFSPTAPSSHPVAAPGRSQDVPGLKAPYSTGSLVYCTDCHASDQSPAAGGTGSRGPHGSIHEYLLERGYSTVDPGVESAAAYALCYKCHDRDTLFRRGPDGSRFPLHRSHVVDRGAACSTCHDAHGISSDAGNTRENAHLVSFNLSVVSALDGARPTYVSEGPASGSCALSCHSTTRHDPNDPTKPSRY